MNHKEFGSTDDYFRAFEAVLAESIPDNHLALLRAHFAAPNHTATWAQLAGAVGYANGSAVNLQYGKLARRVAQKLGVEQPPHDFWLYVLAGWATERDSESGHTAFVMRRPAIEALQRLGVISDDEETKPRSPFQKKMGDAVANATIPLDQAILKLKELYDSMRDEERIILKSWIGQLVPLQRNPVCNLIGKASVSLRHPSGPDEYIEVDGLPPITISKAIESWERGDAYNPGTFRELGWE